jgi:hypothetical protein
MTIQSIEMECAARSAIQAAINDSTAETSIDQIVNSPIISEVLEATYNHQNSGNPLTVTLVDPTNRILKFEQKHRLGIFKGTLNQETRTSIENRPFVQYYQINGTGGAFTFNKCSY